MEQEKIKDGQPIGQNLNKKRIYIYLIENFI